MENFFSRVEHRWPAGDEHYHWHILLDPEELDTRLCRPYRDLTRRAGLVPVQPQWVHITVQHGGSLNPGAATAVTEAEVERITDQVAQECARIPPFDLQIERPQIGGVAVECAVRPGAPARRLWEITTRATTAVCGDRVPVIPRIYWPHLSLAYAVGDVDPGPLKVWLSDSDLGPVTGFRATQISLVAQSHDRREITWRRLLDIPLGGG